MQLYFYIIIMLFVNYYSIHCNNIYSQNNYNYRFSILNKQYRNKMIIRNETLKPLVLCKSNIGPSLIRKCRYLRFKINETLMNYYNMEQDEKEVIELIIGLLF